MGGEVSRANQLTSPEPITNLAIMIKVGCGILRELIKMYCFQPSVDCESSEKNGGGKVTGLLFLRSS